MKPRGIQADISTAIALGSVGGPGATTNGATASPKGRTPSGRCLPPNVGSNTIATNGTVIDTKIIVIDTTVVDHQEFADHLQHHWRGLSRSRRMTGRSRTARSVDGGSPHPLARKRDRRQRRDHDRARPRGQPELACAAVSESRAALDPPPANRGARLIRCGGLSRRNQALRWWRFEAGHSGVHVSCLFEPFTTSPPDVAQYRQSRSTREAIRRTALTMPECDAGSDGC